MFGFLLFRVALLQDRQVRATDSTDVETPTSAPEGTSPEVQEAHEDETAPLVANN
jgi:hypothetical protein